MRGALLMAGVAVALAAIIRLEIPPGATADRPLPSPLAPLPVTQAAPAAIATPAAAWVSTILARPLLSAGRRPAAQPAGAAASLPRLSGLLTWPTGQAAIFQPAEHAKPLVLVTGQTVAGWTIQDITTTSLTLARGSDWLTLTPRAGQPSMQTPPVLPKVVVSRWEAPADTGLLRTRWSNPQLQP